MQFISAETVDRLLDETAVADALHEMFRDGCEQPLRHHHTVGVPGEADATLLLMPAWKTGAAFGVKLATVFPGNGQRGMPAVQGQYLLLDPATGTPTALIDGARLTAWRTAAASGLAARYLARSDARHMLMAGAGTLAPMLIRAHMAARPSIDRVRVWNRNPASAEALAQGLADEGLPVSAATDLEAEVRQADIVSCATLSTEPLVLGGWLKDGAHLDLVGAFRPDMRECDDDAVRRATVFVDTRDGASSEGGDIVQPLKAGVITPDDIAADLYELCRDAHAGRSDDSEVTLFKSVGAALEDLAAAQLTADRYSG
ncbi:MAG: ornithine cyclodeaminase family protein [Minwuia sp.]|uniref:ornithine cyclodeaminase family protein n=1 Tax=Minwuia sp. TaxID=2493630 RepID=UPI003A888F61